MNPAPTENDFQSRMRELGDLLQQVDSIADPAARATTANIIQGLMDFHGAALTTLLNHLNQSGPTGQSILEAAAADDLTSALLLLYGLHPHDLPTRVHTAINKLHPHLHGGKLELLNIADDAAITLQFRPAGHACPSSTGALKQSIEQAIYERAPEATAIHIHDDATAAKGSTGFVPLDRLLASAARNHQLQGASS